MALSSTKTRIRGHRSASALSLPRARRKTLLRIASVIAVLLIYHWASTRPGVNNALVPTLGQILDRGWSDITGGTLAEHAIWSLRRVVLGFFVGATLGVVIGLLVGYFWQIEAAIDPLIRAVRPIPPLAFIPLVILWLGIGEASKVTVIAFGAFVISVLNVITGVKNSPSIYLDAGRTLGAGPVAMFTRILIPSALPFILAGLRLALAVSWAVLVAAELVAADRGLGYSLVLARRFIQADAIFVGIIAIGVLATVMDRMLRAAESYLLRWRGEAA